MAAEARNFIEENKGNPFFIYFALKLPDTFYGKLPFSPIFL